MEELDKSVYLKDIEYFSAKLEQDPSSALFVPLGKAFLKLENYDDAARILAEGIDANPDMLSAKTLLASAYMGQGKKDDAKAILTEVQVVDKCNYLASKLLGDILRNEEDIKKALINYRTALMVAPEDKDLRDLVEELMASHGIAAHELEEDGSLMDADDDMLTQLGEELAEEVKTEVGEGELENLQASDEEVSDTVDSIVGVEEESSDMSLDSFQEDSDDDFSDELEEELVASFDDEIVPMDMSADTDTDVVADESGAIKLDDEIMQGDGEAPSEDDVQALAAELGADLGLDIEVESPVADEVDAALEEVFGEENSEQAEEKDTGLSLFEGVEEEETDEELDDELKAMMGESPVADEDSELDDDIQAALNKESKAEPMEPELDDDLKAMLGEEPEAEEEETGSAESVLDDEIMAMLEDSDAEPELDDDLKAMLGEDSADEEIAAEEAVEEPEQVAEVSDFDDLESMLNGAQAASDEDEPETEKEEITAEETAENIEETVDEIAEPETEEVEEAEKEPEEEIFEASMEELLETPEQEETEKNELENLPPETREQVNRLENLLETIKNNAGS